MKKLILLSAVFSFAIFLHFHNKYSIGQYGAKCNKLKKQISTLQEVNRDLVSQQQQYLSKQRICSLASERLGMVYSKDIDKSVCFVEESGPRTNTAYMLVNYLAPKAMAITP